MQERDQEEGRLAAHKREPLHEGEMNMHADRKAIGQSFKGHGNGNQKEI